MDSGMSLFILQRAYLISYYLDFMNCHINVHHFITHIWVAVIINIILYHISEVNRNCTDYMQTESTIFNSTLNMSA